MYKFWYFTQWELSTKEGHIEESSKSNQEMLPSLLVIQQQKKGFDKSLKTLCYWKNEVEATLSQGPEDDYITLATGNNYHQD